MCKKSEDTCNRFDRIPACDRQTDGQTSCDCIVRPSSCKNWSTPNCVLASAELQDRLRHYTIAPRGHTEVDIMDYISAQIRKTPAIISPDKCRILRETLSQFHTAVVFHTAAPLKIHMSGVGPPNTLSDECTYAKKIIKGFLSRARAWYSYMRRVHLSASPSVTNQ